MIKNFKIFLLFILVFSLFLSCNSSKEKSANNKVFVNTNSLEIVIADSILESYIVQESSKNL